MNLKEAKVKITEMADTIAQLRYYFGEMENIIPPKCSEEYQFAKVDFMHLTGTLNLLDILIQNEQE